MDNSLYHQCPHNKGVVHLKQLRRGLMMVAQLTLESLIMPLLHNNHNSSSSHTCNSLDPMALLHPEPTPMHHNMDKCKADTLCILVNKCISLFCHREGQGLCILNNTWAVRLK